MTDTRKRHPECAWCGACIPNTPPANAWPPDRRPNPPAALCVAGFNGVPEIPNSYVLAGVTAQPCPDYPAVESASGLADAALRRLNRTRTRLASQQAALARLQALLSGAPL